MYGLANDSFCHEFGSEEACIQALFHARWPSGFLCPACGYSEFYVVASRRLPLYQCASPCCRRQTSIIAGTVMEGSRTPLTLWFRALYWLSQPSGISSLALSNLLQVSYKTAWLITHKIRHAMKHEDSELLLTGEVRVERLFYGSVLFSDARQPLLLGGTQEKDGKPAHIKLHQPHPNHVDVRYLEIGKKGIEAFLQEHTDSQSAVVKERYALKSIPAFSRIKFQVSAWLNDTFRGIGPKHLQAYLHEFCFRWNKQHLDPRSVFGRALERCSVTPVLICRELTKYKPVLRRPWQDFVSKSAWRGWHLTRWIDC